MAKDRTNPERDYTTLSVSHEYARLIRTICGGTGETVQEVLDRLTAAALVKECRRVANTASAYVVLGEAGA